MQRVNVGVERITLQRREPLVPCAYAVGRGELWKRRLESCGTLIPFAPTRPCPHCGQRQARGNAPSPTPDSRIMDRDVAIVDADTGEVAVAYVTCAEDIATDLAADLRGVEFDGDVYSKVNTTTRLSGMAVTHRTFGYEPPQPMRRRYGCSRAQFNIEQPAAMEEIAKFCRVAEHVFRTQATEVHDRTARKVRDLIAPAWLIAGTPWTSGIINQTAALPYHRDRSNVPSSWSAMLGCRRHVEGGLLHLADYDVYLPVAHGSITIFDGQSVVHGVTPLVISHPGGWRYTVVTYAKTMMAQCCGDPSQEARRAALAATAAEDRRAEPTYKAGRRRR